MTLEPSNVIDALASTLYQKALFSPARILWKITFQRGLMRNIDIVQLYQWEKT